MVRKGMKRMEIALDRLREGERGLVTAVELPPARAAALLRLGLCPGTEIRCLRRSPLGDPSAYRFGGLTAALRRADAGRVRVVRQTRGEESR